MHPHHTAPTSLEAYKQLRADGQYAAILAHLRKIAPESACIADIAHATGIDKSSVSGRINELKNRGGILTKQLPRLSHATEEAHSRRERTAVQDTGIL